MSAFGHTTRIPLTPFSRVIEKSLTTSFVTVLKALTQQITPKKSLLLIEVYPNALTETFDVVSLRIVETAEEGAIKEILFICSGDSRGGNLIGLNGGGEIEVDDKKQDLIGLIISDNNQELQLRSTATANNTLTFLYLWVPNPYGHILSAKDYSENIDEITQLGGQMGDASPGKEFHQVGDRFRVG